VQAFLGRTTQGVYLFHPIDFLGLTIDQPRLMERIMRSPPSMSRPERDPPILIVRQLGDVLAVQSHDGRHRAWAAYCEGMGFPVRILSHTPLAGISSYFQGQFDKNALVTIQPGQWYPPPSQRWS